MSIEREVSILGTNVFYTLGSKTNAPELRRALNEIEIKRGGKEIKLGDRFIPEKNTKKAALKQALVSVCSNRRRLVRPLPKGQRGYAVVTENKDENGKSLDHVVDFNVVLNVEDGKMGEPEFLNAKMDGPALEGDCPDMNLILHRYQIELDRLPHHKISVAIVKILDFFHATSLKPTGGLYWLPKDTVFRKVAKAIEDASEDDSNQVFFQRTAKDEDLNRTVISNLRRTITTEAEAILSEALVRGEGEMEKRAIATKEARWLALRKRIAGYQKLFGVVLSDLQDDMEKTETALVAATFSQLNKRRGGVK